MFLIGYLLLFLFICLMGSGGAILIPPILIYFFNLEIKTALAVSLLAIGSLTLFRSLFLVRFKLIDYKMVFVFGFPAMLGTYFGSLVASYNSGYMQLLFYALVIMVGSLLLLRKSDYINIHHEKHFWQVVIDGLVIGLLTSFVGIGGSFLIVPALILMGGLELVNAIATSLIIVAIKSFYGFYLYINELNLQKQTIDWKLFTILMAVSIISLILWHYINRYLKPAVLKVLFSVSLMLSGLSILAYEFLFKNNI